MQPTSLCPRLLFQSKLFAFPRKKENKAQSLSRTSLGNLQGLLTVNVPHLDECSSGVGGIEGGVDLEDNKLGISRDLERTNKFNCRTVERPVVIATGGVGALHT